MKVEFERDEFSITSDGQHVWVKDRTMESEVGFELQDWPTLRDKIDEFVKEKEVK